MAGLLRHCQDDVKLSSVSVLTNRGRTVNGETHNSAIDDAC